MTDNPPLPTNAIAGSAGAALAVAKSGRAKDDLGAGANASRWQPKTRKSGREMESRDKHVM
jgi:hypothetical protein